MTDPSDDETRPLPPVATPDGAGAPGGRWSGRKTALVAAAALGVGTLGAVGATAAVARSDAAVQEDPAQRGQHPGHGRGQLPGGGPGRQPGGDEAPDGRLPGRDGGAGSTDPTDANGVEVVLHA